MDAVADSRNLIEEFIYEHVIGQGLDGRTEKAYRLDLEHFYAWLGQKEIDRTMGDGLSSGQGLERGKGSERGKEPETGESMKRESWQGCAEAYLEYLTKEKKLSSSTICRKNRVLSYYLTYLARKGVIVGYYPPVKYGRRKRPMGNEAETGESEQFIAEGKKTEARKKECGLLSRKDADAFFTAMNREYEDLDSEFRRRICLRDMVMMELLFYHRIEISELLRMQVRDYNPRTGNLVIRRKREGNISEYLYSRELRQKLGMWLEEREHFRRDGEYEDTMFLSKFGKPLSMEMVVKIFDKYRGLAGIREEFTPRDLKEGVMKGYARELVMERLG